MSQTNNNQTTLYAIIAGAFCVIILLAAVVVTMSATSNNTNVSGDRGSGYIVQYTPPAPTPVPIVIVTFQSWDGTILKTQAVEMGASATPPSAPTRAGYTFTGWNQQYTNIQADTTITATYKPLPPNFSLVDSNGRTQAKLSGSTAWYDVGVRNLGGEGYQTIYCQFTQGSTQVTRSQTVYLRTGEYQIVTFTFTEYSSWGGQAYCTAWL